MTSRADGMDTGEVDTLDAFMQELGVAVSPLGPAATAAVQEVLTKGARDARAVVRNRRLVYAQRALESGDTFFSDAEMRERDPALCRAVLEQPRAERGGGEPPPTSAAAVAACASGGGGRSAGLRGTAAAVSLVDVLAASASRRSRAVAEEEGEEEGEEGEEGEDEADSSEGGDDAGDEGGAGGPHCAPTTDDGQAERAALLRAMVERFLSGADAAHFDYTRVDCDTALDLLSVEGEGDAAQAYWGEEEEDDGGQAGDVEMVEHGTGD